MMCALSELTRHRAGLMIEDVDVATSDDVSLTKPAALPADRRRYLAAYIVTVIILVLVLAMLPPAFISMIQELRDQQTDHAYDLFSGAEIEHDQPIAPDATFVNIMVTKLDEVSGTASLTISGHRICPALCPALTGTLYSLGNDSARRHGLPPSASVTVPGSAGSYTFAVELPIRGTPQNYPFDTYSLTLGLILEATFPNGTKQILGSRDVVQHSALLTLEDRVARLDMSPPRPIDPAAVRAPSDPFSFLVVDQVTWERPLYLRILTALLVVLISVSGIYALGLRTLHELVLGIGGLILGIWGIRAIVVQSELPDVTLIDIALGFVILLLLVGLSVRAARYFYVKSGGLRRGIGGK
jgi:hypothetical protein